MPDSDQRPPRKRRADSSRNLPPRRSKKTAKRSQPADDTKRSTWKDGQAAPAVKSARKSGDGPSRSLVRMVVAVMLVIAAFMWAMAAGQYAHGVEGWRSSAAEEMTEGLDGVGRLNRRQARARIVKETSRSFFDFLGNAFTKIPSAHRVIWYCLTDRLWVPIVFLLLECGAIGFGYVALKIERQMREEEKRRRLA